MATPSSVATPNSTATASRQSERVVGDPLGDRREYDPNHHCEKVRVSPKRQQRKRACLTKHSPRRA